MVITTLFAVAPLILAALPAAAVPQHLWKDDTYCVETTTETVTVTQTSADDPSTSTSTDPDGPQVSGFVETTTETVTLTSTLTVVPSTASGSLESADPALSRETKVADRPEAETVTVFNTVTDVNTVTIEILQPTATPSPTLEVDSPTSSGSAVPLPLNTQPYYLNSTVGPYSNSSLGFNLSAPVVPAPPLPAPSPPSIAYSGYENGLYFTNWCVSYTLSQNEKPF